ncbi:DUF1330 domain-containing protein [Steroidobacter sp. S1-65]|uniref:DUF1330 domain-containing protein n=1 Tax=Steroidobacter gossypii TaxID=2805490 RepID=A0ABS1X6P3_9GAMM|nr:DUF1330 domain-containing protein [Steroidobacter gossypii]MBM0108897.1 DUF1330 domain-containing protein [Steroidobacter gossypii]
MKRTLLNRLITLGGVVNIGYGLGLALSFVLGMASSAHYASARDKQPEAPHEKPAYLIASWKTIHPEQIESIRAAIDPLARRAGYELLSASAPELLEGSWPYDGNIIVQRYRSMDALRTFWFSPEHQLAKKTREGHIESQFVIAVEAYE